MIQIPTYEEYLALKKPKSVVTKFLDKEEHRYGFLLNSIGLDLAAIGGYYDQSDCKAKLKGLKGAQLRQNALPLAQQNLRFIEQMVWTHGLTGGELIDKGPITLAFRMIDIMPHFVFMRNSNFDIYTKAERKELYNGFRRVHYAAAGCNVRILFVSGPIIDKLAAQEREKAIAETKKLIADFHVMACGPIDFGKSTRVRSSHEQIRVKAVPAKDKKKFKHAIDGILVAV